MGAPLGMHALSSKAWLTAWSMGTAAPSKVCANSAGAAEDLQAVRIMCKYIWLTREPDKNGDLDLGTFFTTCTSQKVALATSETILLNLFVEGKVLVPRLSQRNWRGGGTWPARLEDTPTLKGKGKGKGKATHTLPHLQKHLLKNIQKPNRSQLT